MKALSIREPWAGMIRNGKKTIETRTWSTKYRGKLLLCTSKSPERSFSGKAFAVASLVDVRPMTVEDEAKACCRIYEKAQSWILESLTFIDPFVVKGRLGLFEVDYEKD